MSEMFAGLAQKQLALQEKRRRLDKIEKRIQIGLLAMLLVALVFFIYEEPAYLVPAVTLVVAIFLFIYVLSSNLLDPDPDQPDGGFDLANNLGCIFTVVMLVLLFIIVISAIEAISQTNDFLNVILVLWVLGIWLWLSIFVKRARTKIIPNAETLGVGCWVCETGAHQNGGHFCPICGFQSKAKDPLGGLKRHITNKHQIDWSSLSMFSNGCEVCRPRKK